MHLLEWDGLGLTAKPTEVENGATCLRPLNTCYSTRMIQLTENESGSLHHQLSEFVRLLSPPLLICTHWESSARASKLHCLELSTAPKQWHEDVRIMQQLLIRGS